MNEDTPWMPPSADDAHSAEDGHVNGAPEQSEGSASDGEAPSPWSPAGADAWAQAPAPVLPDAPSAPPAPEPPAPWSAPAFGVEPIPVEPTAADPTQAELDPDVPPPTSARRSKAAVAGAAVAVVALGLAGLFAVNRMSDGTTGGAGTAEELGEDLMVALESEDVLGVIDTLLPGERDSLGQPFVETITELQRLEVLAADTDLSSLAGLDIELTNESVQVVGTNVADIVNVQLSADALVTFDGAELPIGALIEDNLPDDMLVELRNTRLADSEPFDLELTAVQDGDSWYFSAFHTIAELARRDAGGQPIPVVGVAPLGADTPEGAVRGLLDQIEEFDLEGVIAALDPAEAAALQRYAPLFLDDAQAELDRLGADVQIDVDLRVEGDGAERTAFGDRFVVTGSAEGVDFSFRSDDGCVTIDDGVTSFEQCALDQQANLDDMFGESEAIGALITEVQDAFADIEPIGLELREHDGRWYVSPLATGTEALLKAMRALDRSEVDRIVDSGERAVDEFFSLMYSGFDVPGLIVDDQFTFDEPVVVDDESIGDVVDEPVSVWDRCYEKPDATEATRCFDEAVVAGELTAVDVPVVLRHPECGLSEASWSGTTYELSDEEFTAVVGSAVPCFEALVVSGELSEWEVPFEVTNFGCFENRNWFSTFDDEYDSRVSACMEALVHD